ncbi:MAG: magnesium-translocating P-type ATPase [Deltaproteobacteria bacterium]|nr:magnesium-translocating P-type ATPase [Deltaproteobacteria bacterium]
MSTPPQYWSLDAATLLAALEARTTGLGATEAAQRLRIAGPNRVDAGHHGPWAAALGSQARNPLLWLLLVAAAISVGVGEVTDAIVVAAILVFGTAISLLQDVRAGHALERLRARTAMRSTVLRDGAPLEVAATAVVTGDVLVLAAGSLIPADAVVLETRELIVGESLLTGEPFPVDKHAGPVAADTPLAGRTNVVHMGTSVRSGSGHALVVATGGATAFGQVAKQLAHRSPATDFELGLRHFGYLLLRAMLALVFVVFAASAIRGHAPIEALLFALALAVGLAPEMLPAVLATMLSGGARRMAKRGVLVRRLEAIENLGNMDVLCTDKTGTLTEGEVRLASSTDAAGVPAPEVLRLARDNAALQAGIVNPIDRAIVAAAVDQAAPLPRKLDEIPFDFTRKRLSVLMDRGGASPLLVTKGAFESVLAVCTAVREHAGVVPLDDAALAAIRARAGAWSREGMRVIAVASRAWPDTTVARGAEAELVFEGFLCFRDPPKAGAAEAIDGLRALGVRVKIVSGDHREVVRHVGARLGFVRDEVVTGAELAQLVDTALWHVVERADMFAEVDPMDKERILVALSHGGHVVGFMGDGINDAPALHAADVGISVEGAVDVAREAADFVLLQRGLDSVREGVLEGRKTFANTMKYVLTTESANLGNMLSMAAAALFLPFLPLLAHQVLLNNFLSDIPSTTLSTDRVDDEMLQQPRGWDLGFIRRFMIVFGLLSAAFDGLTFVLLTMWFRVSPAAFHTAWFVESLLTELLVLLVLRTQRRCWSSRPHAALWGSTLVVAVAAFAIPMSPAGSLLGFVPLPTVQWLALAAIALGYAITIEAVKRPLQRWIARPRPPRRGRFSAPAPMHEPRRRAHARR